MSDSETNNFTFSKATDIEAKKVLPIANPKNGRYVCNECDTRFVTQFLLNLHRVSRCPKLPHPCPKCELRFANEANLESHQKIHSAPKTKQIAVAKMDAKLLGSASEAKTGQHVKGPKETTSTTPQSNGKRSRRAPVRFLQKAAALDFIQRTKTQAKSLRNAATTSVVKKEDLKLNDDDESDTKQGTKKVLRNKSSSSGKFSCDLCKINFPDQTKLDRHMIVHGPRRSFQCTKCHMGFHWKSNYKRHMKTHSKPLSNAYVCVTCGRVFSRRFCLFQHRKIQHPEEELYLEDELMTDILALPPSLDDDPQTQVVKEDEDADEDRQDESKEDVKGEVKEKVDEDRQDYVKEEVDDDDTEVDSGGDRKSNEDDTTYYASEREDEDIKTRRSKRFKDQPRRHKCDVCQIQFKWKCDLTRHRRSHDDIKAYMCDSCELGFNWKSNLTRHRKAVHGIGVDKAKHTCDACGRSFMKKFHLDRHVSKYCTSINPALVQNAQAKESVKTEKESVEEKPVKDLMAEEIYPGINQVQNEEILPDVNHAHSEEELFPDIYKAESEEEIVPDVNQVKNEKTSSEVPTKVNIVYLHVCGNNGSVYDTEKTCENVLSSFENHVDTSTKDRSCVIPSSKEDVYQGKIMDFKEEDSEDTGNRNCVVPNLEDDFELARNIALEDELEEDYDSIDYPFVCSKCGRGFARKTCWVQHERSHVIQPTKCRWCGKTFRRVSMLHKHERTEHKGEKPFPCDICSAHFEYRTQLVQHMKSHFRLKSQVARHLKSSQEEDIRHEESFVCNVCKCKFNLQDELDRHQLVHVGERPYRCDTCDLAFDQSCRLVLHQKIHVVEYRCSKCDVAFTEQVNYVRHLERVHFDGAPDKVRTRRSRSWNRPVDTHAYNTRYRACKAEAVSTHGNPVLETADVYDVASVSVASAVPEFKPQFYNSALHQELFKVNEHESTTVKSTGISGNVQNGEYSREGSNCDSEQQKFAESHSQVVFSKGLEPRKYISSYDSDSLDEFIKSYKRTHCAMEENINSSVDTKREVVNEDLNIEVIQNKRSKNKNIKSRSRRSSEEILISQGLANFHIGTFEIRESGISNISKEFQENDGSKTVENRSFDAYLTTDNNNQSYTNQGSYIIQDIITVESVGVNSEIHFKCNENSKSNDKKCGSEMAALSNKSCKTNISETVLEEIGYNNSKSMPESLQDNDTNDTVLYVTENTDSPDNLNTDTSELIINNKTNEISRDIKHFNMVEVDQHFIQDKENNTNEIFNQNPVQSDSVELQSSLKIEDSTDSKLIHETDRLVLCSFSEQNVANASKVCDNTDGEKQSIISNARSILRPKELRGHTNDDEERNNRELVNHSTMSIKPLHMLVKGTEFDNPTQQDRTSNSEETKRFRPYIEIIKVPKNDPETEKDTKPKENLDQSSTIIRKLESMTDKLTQNINNVDEHETDDLKDEILIDEDNDGICKIHSDKSDCIRGICTDNDNCLNDVNTDNDCNVDNDSEMNTRNNNSVNEICSYPSNNCFATVRANETLQKGLFLNDNTFKNTFPSTFPHENTNLRYPNIASKTTGNSRNRDLNEPGREFNSFQNNPAFDKIAEHYRYNQAAVKQETALNLTCYNQQVIQPPVWKGVFDSASNKNLPSCQYELQSNSKNNAECAVYTGQNRTFTLDTDSNNRQFPQFHNDHFQHESTWKAAQVKEYPLNHNFVGHNENIPMPTGEATYCPRNQQDGIVIERNFYGPNESNHQIKNQWNQQDGMVIERNIQEVPGNCQEPRYENDIDEESIRYAVQTVQAIIQSERPREQTCRQTPVQELVRYETPSFPVPDYDTFQAPVIRYQNFQVPSYRVQESCDGGPVYVHDMVRYQTPVPNDVYVPQGLYRDSYHPIFQPQNVGAVQYGGYVDRNNEIQRTPIPVRPENVIDYDGRLVQFPSAAQYRDSPFSSYPVRRNSVIYREHFEEGQKQYLDLVPVPHSSEPYPNERASVNCMPYERVEVKETVYTNLELASYARPTGEAVFIPYKEVINDPTIMHKGQRNIVHNVHYRDMYPYAPTPDGYYTHPVRTHTPNPAMFRIEKAYTYPPVNEKESVYQQQHRNFQQDVLPKSGQNSILVSHSVPESTHNPILVGQSLPKGGQNSILVGQSTRGRKRARKAQSEAGAPKKPRRKKNESLNLQNQGHCDQVKRSTVIIDQFNRKELNNEEVTRIDSRSKEYSIPETEIRISEKSFGCDECNRVFLLKNDLLRHQVTEHK